MSRPTVATLVLVALCLSCRRDEPVKEYEKHFRSVPPTVRIGEIHYSQGMTDAEKRRDTEAIAALITQLIRMVDEQNLEGLPSLVSRKHGLWVDVKAHRTFDQLKVEIRKKDGYLQKYFLDTDQLRRSTKDEHKLSVRDVLRHTDTVRADFYMLADGSCEVELFLEQYPPYKFHLNQPAFLKEDGVWKVHRLF